MQRVVKKTQRKIPENQRKILICREYKYKKTELPRNAYNRIKKYMIKGKMKYDIK